MRQGWRATKRKCSFERSRLGSLRVRRLLSIFTCKRSLRCIGFSGFKRELMRFAWCEGFSFAATAAFPYDCDSARPYANPNLCCVSHCMVPVSHARPDAVGGNRLPIPGVIAKNSIGLGDNMPAFDIGEDGVLRPARLDVLRIELGL